MVNCLSYSVRYHDVSPCTYYLQWCPEHLFRGYNVLSWIGRVVFSPSTTLLEYGDEPLTMIGFATFALQCPSQHAKNAPGGTCPGDRRRHHQFSQFYRLKARLTYLQSIAQPLRFIRSCTAPLARVMLTYLLSEVVALALKCLLRGHMQHLETVKL